MTLSRLFKRLIAGDRVIDRAASLRGVIAWVFIALVALFLTQPAGGPGSVFDAPVAWPVELGVDGSLGF